MRSRFSLLLAVFAALLGAISAPAAHASGPVIIIVNANADEVDSSIDLGVGQQATITATGDPFCQSEGTSYPCGGLGPNGSDRTCEEFSGLRCPAPKLPAWSLVGRTGSGAPWQLIGEGPTTLVGPGRISFAYNDDGFDNFGEFEAVVEVSDVGTAQITSITGTPKSVAPRSSSIPLSALPAQDPLGKGTDNLAQAPLRSSPLRSSPLRSSPLRSSPLRSSPLRSSALGALTLAQLPLRSSSWDALLAGTPLDVPPAALTLDQVLSLNPLPAGLRDLSLADIDLAKTPLRSSSLAEVLLAGATLNQLKPPVRSWCRLLGRVSDCDLSQSTLSDVVKAGELDPGELGLLSLGDPETDISGTILAGIPLSDLNLSATPLAGRTDLGQFQTVGDLVNALPLPNLADLTLGDLLPGLVSTPELPLELAPLGTILNAAPRQSTGLLTYAITVRSTCDPTTLTASATLPRYARYTPGTATVTTDLPGATPVSLPDPAANATTLAFDLSAALDDACASEGTHDLTVRFTVEPPAVLGAPLIAATVRADGLPYSLLGPVDTRVDDVDDPGDTPRTAAPISSGNLRTGFIAAADDGDAYRFDAPPVGSTVTVTLSHLPADYDLSVTGPAVGIPSAPLRSSPLRSSPLRSSPLRSSTIGDDGDERTAPITPTTLQDLPLRSSELAQTPLRSSSINRGLNTESTTFTVTPDDAGQAFTIHVTGYDGAHSDDPYVLRVNVTPPTQAPQCRAARTLDGSAPKGAFPGLPLPAATKTIFLINEQRLAQLYPSADIAALRTKLNALAARPEVAGAVVPVESDTANPTGAAYAAWDANPCSVKAANDVAAAVRAVVGNATQNLDELRNIVVIGGDAVIPQVRVPDLTSTANESEEADALVFGGKDSAASRSLRDGFLLTDDAYGDFDPERGLGSAVFVPDVALGRLVETPAQIGAQVDQYVASSGTLQLQSAYVSGYDFLKDGSDAILAQLSGLNLPTTKAVDETWTAADAATALNRTTPGITSVNAHYDHYRALPAAAFNGLVPDLLRANQIRPQAGSLLFTAGCHAGLNLNDVDLPDAGTADAARLQDWAQQVTDRAVFIANTTYGYGDTDTVAYSERLLELLASGIASQQATSGQALMLAKQRYAAEQAIPGVYEQKSSMGLTYYGLPFFKVGPSGGEAPAVLPSTPPAGTQVRSSAFTVDPEFVRHENAAGEFWYSVGSETPQATHDRPIQPRTIRDVTATDGLPVHGAVVEELSVDLDYGQVAYSDPVIDHSAAEPENPVSEREGQIFPSWIVRTTRGATTQGLRDQLVVVPGQYNQSFRQQSLYRHVAGQVLRSDSLDYDPPQIRSTDAFIPRGADYLSSIPVDFSVNVISSDAVRAFVLYRGNYDPNSYRKAELTKDPVTGLWRGTGTLDPFWYPPSYVVQVVDAAGNVGVSTSKGQEFVAREQGSSQDAPGFATTPEAPGNGYARGPITVTLNAGRSNGATFLVSVDGAAPFQYSGPFQVTGDGVHTVRFTGSDGSSGGTLVRIDSTAPQVTGSTTATASPEGFVAGPVTVNWACSDAVSGVDTCPSPTVISTEGTGVTVTSPNATDVAENGGTGSFGPINVDINAPTGSIGGAAAALRSGTIVPTAPIAGTTTVTGAAADTLAGVRGVQVTFTSTTTANLVQIADATVTCTTADRRSCTWSVAAPTTTGTWNVSAVVTDRAGRTTTVTSPTPITTGTSTGGGGGGDDDDDDHNGGGNGGGNGPPPVCTEKVSVTVTVPLVVIVRGKPTVQLVKVKVTVIVVVKCCPKPSKASEAKACAKKNARVARKKAKKKARKIAKQLAREKSADAPAPSKRTP